MRMEDYYEKWFIKNLSKTAAALLTAYILMGSGMMEIGGFGGDGIGRLTVNAVSEETPAISFFTQIDEDDNLIISSFFGNEKNVVIPSEINGHKVVAIGESALEETINTCPK